MNMVILTCNQNKRYSWDILQPFPNTTSYKVGEHFTFMACVFGLPCFQGSMTGSWLTILDSAILDVKMWLPYTYTSVSSHKRHQPASGARLVVQLPSPQAWLNLSRCLSTTTHRHPPQKAPCQMPQPFPSYGFRVVKPAKVRIFFKIIFFQVIRCYGYWPWE